MIVEQRRYSLVPGGSAAYLRAWNASGRRPQVRHLGEPLGEKSHHLLHTHYTPRGR